VRVGLPVAILLNRDLRTLHCLPLLAHHGRARPTSFVTSAKDHARLISVTLAEYIVAYLRSRMLVVSGGL